MSEELLEILKPIAEPQRKKDIRIMIDTLRELGHQDSKIKMIIMEKYELSAYGSADLQFIGTLQTNKVKYLIGKVSLIQSVGSLRLAQAIDRCYGSFERFHDVFTQTALSQFGSGWAWLAACPDGGISVLSTSNQETPLSRGLRPVLCVDVWEHAYYLDHQNRREAYLDCWWGLVDWEFAEENFLPCCGGSASRPRSL